MKVYIEVYGCTANRSDADIIRGVLSEKGYEFTKNPKDADILIILTCTVIASTEQRMISRIKKLRKFGKMLIVSGCMVSVQADLVKKVAPESRLLPPDRVGNVGELIESDTLPKESRTKTSLPRCYDGIIAPIAISEGCIFSCTYCITTKARGKLRSFPIKEIVKLVEDAVNKGCKEIQLTAQDLASYGMDSGESLRELIEEVCEVEGDFMVRLGMMNPRTAIRILDDLLQIYEKEKVYKFLHLPVQSGDDCLLERMERGYRVVDFLKIVNTLRGKFPDLTLSTDIIVAFPGEDEGAFMKSIELIEKVEPDIVNITRFSPRAGTKARLFKGRIPTHVAKERSRVLTTICKELSLKRNRKYINKYFKILLTEKGKNGTTVGRTYNYKPVAVPADLPLGTFTTVKIVDAKATHLLGELVGQAGFEPATSAL